MFKQYPAGIELCDAIVYIWIINLVWCYFFPLRIRSYSAPLLFPPPPHSYSIQSEPSHSHDLIGNSPYYLPYNSYNGSSENLVLDQLIIPWLIFFFLLITCLLNIVLILRGEFMSWSLMGVKGLREKSWYIRRFSCCGSESLEMFLVFALLLNQFARECSCSMSLVIFFFYISFSGWCVFLWNYFMWNNWTGTSWPWWAASNTCKCGL